MSEEKKPVRKKILATGQMRDVMSNHFYDLDNAAKSGEIKVAWCTSVGPAELLRALGYLVYFPENHGAMLGSTRQANDYIPLANSVGFSPDICSYLTADVGAYIKGETPITKGFEGIDGVPKPDVLIYNTNQCRDVQDWFNWYGRKLNVPVYGVTTNRSVGDVNAVVVESISKQIKAMVEPLEQISGNKFDIDKLRETVRLSRECTELWNEVLETAANSPAPITFFDDTIMMGPAVVARGTQEAVDFYKVLLAELQERVKNNIAAVEGEKFRIYWEGMPVWGRLRAHSELFSSLQTSVVASTYCNSWVFSSFDEKDPFDSMARAYTELFIARSEKIKEKYLKRMFEFYKIDGVLYHDAKTCPNNSNCRYGMAQRLEEETGIPSIIINGDLNDMRCISDEQTKTNIEAFIEQLADNK